MSQTNVKTGPIAMRCGEYLALATNHLVKLTHDAGTPQMVIPPSQEDITPYLVLEGTGTGGIGSFQPLEPSKNVRIPIAGTCNPGDILVLGNPGFEQAGRVTVLPSEPGNYRTIGIAEEAAVDGQHVLLRPYLAPITVT